jgi:hypothetical protein
MGASLLSPCIRILKRKPPYVYLNLNQNKQLLMVIESCRTLLRESTKEPTRCRQLVTGWPDYIGFVDTSGHGLAESLSASCRLASLQSFGGNGRQT